MLSIIFVNYKCSSDILNCLNSIKKNDSNFYYYEIIIVDNASEDPGLEKIKQKFPGTVIVFARKNGGFAYGNNIGFDIASNNILFMLNPDTFVKDNSIQLLYKRLTSDPFVSMVGPLLLNPDGSNQSYVHPKTYPTIWNIFCERFFLNKLFPKSRLFNSYYQTYMKYNEERNVEQICGAAIMFKRDILHRIGKLDENYFMYFEESDWCKQAINKGGKLLYCPEATVYHKKGLTHPSKSRQKAIIFGTSLIYYLEKNSRFSYATSLIYAAGCCFRLLTINRLKIFFNNELLKTIIKRKLLKI